MGLVLFPVLPWPLCAHRPAPTLLGGGGFDRPWGLPGDESPSRGPGGGRVSLCVSTIRFPLQTLPVSRVEVMVLRSGCGGPHSGFRVLTRPGRPRSFSRGQPPPGERWPGPVAWFCRGQDHRSSLISSGLTWGPVVLLGQITCRTYPPKAPSCSSGLVCFLPTAPLPSSQPCSRPGSWESPRAGGRACGCSGRPGEAGALVLGASWHCPRSLLPPSAEEAGGPAPSSSPRRPPRASSQTADSGSADPVAGSDPGTRGMEPELSLAAAPVLLTCL